MSYDQYSPYGPLVDTTMRIATWNVWGRWGDDHRQVLIEDALLAAQPDVVCLVESWSTASTNQPEQIAKRLDVRHREAQLSGGRGALRGPARRPRLRWRWR